VSSTTPANSAHARRKAALLRALAGIAQQGPALGTDPFGSFQAGIRGALSAGAEQEAQVQQAQQRAIQQQYMEAQMAHMLRPPQEYSPRPWYQDPNVDPELRAKYEADALYHPQAQGQNEKDWTVDAPQYGPTESGAPMPPARVLPGFLQGVPPAARKTAAQQYYEKQYGTTPQPKAPPASQVGISDIEWAQANEKNPDPRKAAHAKAIITYYQNRVNPVTGGTTDLQYDENGNVIHTTRTVVRGGQGVTVTANGKTYTFKDQASADAFRAHAGIK